MGWWTSTLILWGIGAWAGDSREPVEDPKDEETKGDSEDPKDEDPKDDPEDSKDEEKPISVETLEEYEKLLMGLDNYEPPIGPIYQLFDGVTEIMAPLEPKRPDQLLEAGEVVTKVTTDALGNKHYTESWVVFRPEVVLRGAQELEYAGGVLGGFPAVLEEYGDLPNASEYGWLEFNFDYLAPPLPAAIANLPNVVPPFVTNVYRFSVITDVGGVEEESGALYRERSLDNGKVLWRDVWVLWGNYQFPTAANGAITELVGVPFPAQTLKAFLQAQAAEDQWLYVHTKSKVQAVP